MYIYLLTFACSILGIIVSEKQYNKLLRNIIVVVSLLLPSLLAGFRSINIGTDVLTYVKPLFDLALQSDNFVEFLNLPIYRTWRYLPVYTIEIGYLLLTYIVTKLFHSLIVLNFIISFIMISLIYFGLVKMNRINSNISIPFGLLTFYLLFFNGSLNLVRQYLAYSIVIFGFNFIIERKIWKYVLVVILATSFHKTAIFSIFLYIIYGIIVSNKKIVFDDRNKGLYIKTIFFFLLIIFLCLFIVNPTLFNSLFKIFDLDGYMTAYLSGSYSFSKSYFLVSIPILILILVNIKKLWKNDITCFFVILYCSYTIFTQLSSYSPYAIRIADIFSIYSIYSLSIFSFSKNSKILSFIFKFLLVVYLLIYWYLVYYSLNIGQTVPYISCLH